MVDETLIHAPTISAIGKQLPDDVRITVTPGRIAVSMTLQTTEHAIALKETINHAIIPLLHAWSKPK